MKCKACGFDDNEISEWEWGFTHIGSIRDDGGQDKDLYICPECRTIRGDDSLLP